MPLTINRDLGNKWITIKQGFRQVIGLILNPTYAIMVLYLIGLIKPSTMYFIGLTIMFGLVILKSIIETIIKNKKHE